MHLSGSLPDSPATTGLSVEWGNPSLNIEPLGGSVILIDPNTPDLFSEAIGAMMLFNPRAALEYLKAPEFQPFETQVANSEKVFSALAKIDPDAALQMLREPEFEKFAPSIARGLVLEVPGLLSEVIESIPDPNQQLEELVSVAIGSGGAPGLHQLYPLNPRTASFVDRDRVVTEIESVIEISSLDESQRSVLRHRLRPGPILPPDNLSFDLQAPSKPSVDSAVQKD